MPLLMHEERIGTTLNDKYRLDGLLGRGGMAAVFAATHLWTGRPVAVKMLNPEYACTPEMAQRFLREARTAAGLKHPNVVDVLDMGSDGDAVYLVLELLTGKTLGELVDLCGAQAPIVCASVLLPVMGALVHAHEHGVIHRDLKPDNVFIADTPSGGFVPKLVDFGIAKVLDAADRGSTRVGTVLGTPQYMSPEQATGAADLGAQADVWSMGVVWYECLSGKLPYDGTTSTAILVAVVNGKHVPLHTLRPELPLELCTAVEWALESDRADRCPDMASFTEAILTACESAHIGRVKQIDLSRLRQVKRRPVPAIASSQPDVEPLTQSLRPAPQADTEPDESVTGTNWPMPPSQPVPPRRPFVMSAVMAVALGGVLGTVHMVQPRAVRHDAVRAPPRREGSMMAQPAPPIPDAVVRPPAPRPVSDSVRPTVTTADARSITSSDPPAARPSLRHEPAGRPAAPRNEPRPLSTATSAAPETPELPSVRANNDPLTDYE